MAMAKGRSMQDWKLFLESSGVDSCTLLHYLIALADVEELRRNKESLIAHLIASTSTTVDPDPCPALGIQQQSKGLPDLQKQEVVKMKEDQSIKPKLEEEYKKIQRPDMPKIVIKKIQRPDMPKIQDPVINIQAQKKPKIQVQVQVQVQKKSNSKLEFQDEKMLSIKRKLEEEYKKEQDRKRQHKIQVIQDPVNKKKPPTPTSKIQVEKKRKLETTRKQCAREMQRMPPLWGAPRKLSSTLKSF